MRNLRSVLALTLVLAPACAVDSMDAADRDGAPDGALDGATDGEIVDSVAVVNVQLANTVVDAPGATGTGFGDPTRAVNGVRGAGTMSGSLDVFSLGYTSANDHITVRWANAHLDNGPGADFAVFENPFLFSGGSFMDLVIIEVSYDGTNYREIAHDYTSTTPTVYSRNPAHWSGFAGRTPVLLNADTNPVDPFNATLAGGDQFDLDNVVGTDAVATQIRTSGARFIRLISAPARIDPHTGAAYVRDALSNGADIDGVYGRYVATP